MAHSQKYIRYILGICALLCSSTLMLLWGNIYTYAACCMLNYLIIYYFAQLNYDMTHFKMQNNSLIVKNVYYMAELAAVLILAIITSCVACAILYGGYISMSLLLQG